MELPMVRILSGGILLLAINLLVYLDRRHGMTRACRSAREFCRVSFSFFLVATLALLDLTTQVWIDPQDNVALAVLMSAGIGLALTTSSALGFCVATHCQ